MRANVQIEGLPNNIMVMVSFHMGKIVTTKSGISGVVFVLEEKDTCHP